MDRKFKKRFLKTEINRKVDTKIFVEAYFSTYKQFNYALDEARWIERSSISFHLHPFYLRLTSPNVKLNCS